MLAQTYPGRLVLGLGAGYLQQAAAVGREFGSPLAAMRDYLERMTAEQRAVLEDPARYLGAAAQQPSKVVFRQSEPVAKHFNASEAAWPRSDMLKARTSPSNSVTRLALTTNSASLPRI